MLKSGVLLVLLGFFTCFCYAQVVTECPQNVGLENGTFSNWQTYTGGVGGSSNFPGLARGEVGVTASVPAADRHAIIRRGSGTDYYGGFSTDSPNGSNYVVKLGNDQTGAQAERISYLINVPSNVENYSIIFNYAVVLQNPLGNHEAIEQPRFTAKIVDVSTGKASACGSFEFVSPGAVGVDGLPGFIQSTVVPATPPAQNQNGGGGMNNPSEILYKTWSPVMLNLSEYKGSTVRIEFTTVDCTRGGHFGYAYIDFNENCSIPITGNITCPEAKSLMLQVLPGFSRYRWFNANTSKDLGSDYVVKLDPIPPTGTRIGVELIPFDNLGCPQILYTTITNIDFSVHDPPPDCFSVDITAISVTVGNSSDLTYTYWTNAAATTPLDNPKAVMQEGIYYIKARSSSGCVKVQPVVVTIIRPPDMGIRNPAPVTYPSTVDITKTFTHVAGMTYTYWIDKGATYQLKNPASIKISGRYYIKVADAAGCFRISPVDIEVIINDIAVNNTFTPNGDGTNDVFTILINDKVKLKYFRIFNRYGTIVYQTTDITNYWGGFSQNKEVPVGVYYWIIEGILDNKEYRRSGYITVLR